MTTGDLYAPWGSLTGIRPTKVAEKLLISGLDACSVTDALIRDYFVSPERADLCVEVARFVLDFKNSLKSRDIALYIGIPFCTTRCDYCSFVSTDAERSFDLIEPFKKTLIKEITDSAKIVNESDLRVISVYMGGGTPTALSADDLDDIMTALGSSFDLTGSREYTVEAGRPDTITKQKLDVMIRHGADRICVNPQSMSDDVLSAIGRAHNTDDIYRSVEAVRKTGAAINMDIIAGLPGDTLEGFTESIDKVIELKPENITIHTLSLKKGSRIMLENTMPQNKHTKNDRSDRLKFIPEAPLAPLYSDDVNEMPDHAYAKLREKFYSPYYLYRQKYITGGFENTGWCLPGYEGIYNICMMEEFCTVLALGGGGVTKLVTDDGRIRRIFNAKYPREYVMMDEKMKENLGRIKEYAVSV